MATSAHCRRYARLFDRPGCADTAPTPDEGGQSVLLDPRRTVRDG